MSNFSPLSCVFFQQHGLKVAPQLLGKVLHFGPYKGMITETELYRGKDDPASHAFKGPTPRSQIMFGPPGLTYVYLIYGMHHCLNIVTEPDGVASAVLIRGLFLFQPTSLLLDGPGKVCRFLGVTKAHQGVDLTQSSHFYISQGIHVSHIKSLPRVGLSKGKDKLWRFCLSSSEQQRLLSFLLGEKGGKINP